MRFILNTKTFFKDHSSALIKCNYCLKNYGDELFLQWNIHKETNLVTAINKRKAEFLAGRICARLALEALSSQQTSVLVGQDKQPIFPAGFFGSISHTNDSALCLLRRSGTAIAIGVDEEMWIQPAEAQKIHKHILLDQEKSLCESLPIDFHKGLTLFFSAKETFYKAYYRFVERYFGFHEAHIVNVDFNGNEVLIQIAPKSSISARIPGPIPISITASIQEDRVLTYIR